MEYCCSFSVSAVCGYGTHTLWPGRALALVSCALLSLFLSDLQGGLYNVLCAAHKHESLKVLKALLALSVKLFYELRFD